MSSVWLGLAQAKICVVTLKNSLQALEIGALAVKLGLNTLEITLRNDHGLSAISDLKLRYPKLLIGAGTVTSPEQAKAVLDAGADYLVSPGWLDSIYEVLMKTGDARQIWLPGVATPTDVMRAQEQGFSHLKFFPAALNGGLKTLAVFNQLFPNIRFCPTGGIGLEQISDYLNAKNVFAVGGSWLNDPDALGQFLDRV